MFKLAYVGRVPLPRSSSAILKEIDSKSKTSSFQRDLYRGLVAQPFVDNREPQEDLILSLRKHTSWRTPFDEPSFLCFEDVEEHDDEWPKFRLGKKKVSSGFLHLVLSGKGVMKSGSKRIEVRRGDVFLHNPQAMHSFEKTSRRFCTTFCVAVPLLVTYQEIKT